MVTTHVLASLDRVDLVLTQIASAQVNVGELRSKYQSTNVDIVKAQTDIEFAQSEYDRQRQLFEKGFTTKAIHGMRFKQDVHGAMRVPVYDSVSFEHASAQDIQLAVEPRERTGEPIEGPPGVLGAWARGGAMDLAGGS